MLIPALVATMFRMMLMKISQWIDLTRKMSKPHLVNLRRWRFGVE